jgi:hypothetical protein
MPQTDSSVDRAVHLVSALTISLSVVAARVSVAIRFTVAFKRLSVEVSPHRLVM